MRLIVDIDLADRFDPTPLEIIQAVGEPINAGISTSDGRKVKPLSVVVTRCDELGEDWALLASTGRNLLIRGLQALHRERVAAYNAQTSYACGSGQAALNEAAFGIAEVAAMLRAAGAAPSSL